MSNQSADDANAAVEGTTASDEPAPTTPPTPPSDPGESRRPPLRDGGGNGVPELEPPASLQTRLDNRRAQKRWLIDRVRETPSWLTSLVAHLALLLLLGSYIIPPGKRTEAFDLLLLFTEATDPNEEGDLVVVHTTTWETQAEKDIGDEGPDAEAAEQAEAPEEPAAEPAPTEEPQPAQPAEAEEDSVEAAPAAEVVFDEGEEIPSDLDTLFETGHESTVRVGKASRNVVIPPGLDEVSEVDRIVDDFIEYDVGRLTGAAGQMANRRFQQLGRDSIPALVRGLNKSAHIRASCPVVVISQKLENELRKSSDPVMIRYAIDRLGQGVGSRAPHMRRVLGLRDRLRKQYVSLEEQLAATAKEWGLPPSEALLQSAVEASSLPFHQARIRIASPDPIERAGALLATTLQARRWNREQRFALGMTMTEQLARERDMRMAQVHHQAMMRLAYDAPVDVPLSLAANPTVHSQAWRQAWTNVRLNWRNLEAQRLMAQAEQLRRQRKTVASATILRQLATQYADTSYATEANVLLGTLDFSHIASAKYKRAATLEDAGNVRAALKMYEEIQISFPETKAAGIAAARARRIRRAMSAE